MNLPQLTWNNLPATVTVEDGEGGYYLGFAGHGTSGTDSATWAVCRLEKTTLGGLVAYVEKWADGRRKFDQVMDDYASLTYDFAPPAP